MAKEAFIATLGKETRCGHIYRCLVTFCRQIPVISNEMQAIWNLTQGRNISLRRLGTSVVTVPKFQYSVPIPVKIHGSRYQFRYQSKTQKHAN